MTVSFRSQWLTPIWNGIQKVGRLAKETGRLAVDQVQFDSFSGELKNLTRGIEVNGKRAGGDGFHNFGKNFKSAWKTSVAEAGKSSFWKNTLESLKDMGRECKSAFKGAGFFKGLKGAGAAIWKKMPLVGNLATIAFSIPTIYKAFAHKEYGGGFWTGMKEIGKQAISIGVTALAFAVGTAVGSPVLGIALAFGAGMLTDKFVTGKSFADKEAEAKEAAANPQVDATSGADRNPNQIMSSEEIRKRYENQGVAPADNTKVAGPNFEGKDLTDQELLNLTRKNKTPGAATGNTTSPDFTSQYMFNPSGNNAFSGGMGKNFFQQNYMDQDFMAMNAGLIR